MAQYISKDALVAEIEKEKLSCKCIAEYANAKYAQGRIDEIRKVISIINTLEVKEVGTETLTERQRLEVMIVATLSGLEATYEHYKNKYPVSSHGGVVCSRIPAVKHLVETYLVELNKEIQIENLKEEIKKL